MPHLPIAKRADCGTGMPAPRSMWERGTPWDKAGIPLVDAEMDQSPSPLSVFLILWDSFEERVSTAAQMLLQCRLLPAVVSLHLGPAISHPLGMKADSLTSLLGAKFSCAANCRVVSGGKAILGSLCRANVLPSWQLLGGQVSKSPAQAENTGTRLSAIAR